MVMQEPGTLLSTLANRVNAATWPMNLSRIMAWLESRYGNNRELFIGRTKDLLPDKAAEILAPGMSQFDSIRMFLNLFEQRYFPLQLDSWWDWLDTNLGEVADGESPDEVMLGMWANGPDCEFMGEELEAQENVDHYRPGLLALIVMVPNKVIDTAEFGGHVVALEALRDDHKVPEAVLRKLPTRGWPLHDLHGLEGHPRYGILESVGRYFLSATGNAFLDVSYDDVEQGAEINVQWDWNMEGMKAEWDAAKLMTRRMYELCSWLENNRRRDQLADGHMLSIPKYTRMLNEVTALIGGGTHEPDARPLVDTFDEGEDDDG